MNDSFHGMKIDLHCHTKYSLDNEFEPEELIQEAVQKGRGGICVPAHPFRPVDSMSDSAFDRSLFDAVEAMNGGNLVEWNEKAREKAEDIGMPCIGGSDCHGPGKVGRAYTVFDNPVASLAHLIEEISQRRCRPERPGLI